MNYSVIVWAHSDLRVGALDVDWMTGILKLMIREVSGATLVLAALGIFYVVVLDLGSQDYVAAIVRTMMGIALLGSGVELLRPSVGE